MRMNNKLTVRGRYVRDPATPDSKKDAGKKLCLGRIAVDQPFVDSNGDTRSTTIYVEIKAFDDALAQVLISGGAKKGTLIEATGSARVEVDDFEKDGEQRVSYNLVCVLDNPDHHKVVIESHPKGDAA